MNQAFEDFDVSSIPPEFNPLATLDGNEHARLYAGDDKLFVQFRTDPVLNPHKSTKEGRPIFDDVDMIIIRTPGSQLTSVVAPVKRYMDRFGDKYRKWKAGQAEIMSGTPLENFPFFFGKPSMVAELNAMHVRTVEQLAELSDSTKQRIMGGHELSQRAKDWLSKISSAAVDAEKEDLRRRLAELEKLVAEKAEPKVAAPATNTKG